MRSGSAARTGGRPPSGRLRRRVANIRVCNRAAHAGERRQGSPEPVPEVEEGHPDAREAVRRGAPVLKRGVGRTVSSMSLSNLESNGFSGNKP